MNKRSIIAAIFFFFGPVTGKAIELACPPAGYDVAQLRQLKEKHFVFAEADKRAAFARALLACLASPDAELRDKIAYEAFATWRHDKSLDAATWKFMEQKLLGDLDAKQADPDGVIKPFAVLILVEAVKADRATPYLNDAERHTLLDAAIAYLSSVRDYRGFDVDVGWRHGVAHASDLLGELALEPSFGKAELDRELGAIATQIVAADGHFYIYGEGERLAAAVSMIGLRASHSPQDWDAWFTRIAAPAPFAKWADVYWSQAGLAKRHDTMAFLIAIYADTVGDKRPELAQIATAAAKAIGPLN